MYKLFNKISNFCMEEDGNPTMIGWMLVGIIFIFSLGILGFLVVSGFCDIGATIFGEKFEITKFLIGLLKISIGAGIPCGIGASES